jgi:hypothetical protein
MILNSLLPVSYITGKAFMRQKFAS